MNKSNAIYKDHPRFILGNKSSIVIERACHKDMFWAGEGLLRDRLSHDRQWQPVSDREVEIWTRRP